ncbi:hypothetical protein DKX38_027143 [Salix brachista]|uniref:Uncharacterized protein n=1 Tax=Salix brachista TaxID=2182728 RepID=A0A5N5JGK1_9ROSI|nr:hypothetical protein DKX38_027143 [Salix brachista]
MFNRCKWRRTPEEEEVVLARRKGVAHVRQVVKMKRMELWELCDVRPPDFENINFNLNSFRPWIEEVDDSEFSEQDAEEDIVKITRDVRVAVEHDFATEREVDVDNQELSAESAVGVENSQYEPEHTSVEHPMNCASGPLNSGIQKGNQHYWQQMDSDMNTKCNVDEEVQDILQEGKALGLGETLQIDDYAKGIRANINREKEE